MQSKAATPDEYISELPAERREIVTVIRDTINRHIPEGFVEGMAYGMIGWAVPHSIYPKGYHVDPSRPLGLISLAAQKNHIAVYHMGLYPETDLHRWFMAEWPRHSTKKVDLGKSCLRFKKPEDVPLTLIGDLASKLTPDEWIRLYEQAVNR